MAAMFYGDACLTVKKKKNCSFFMSAFSDDVPVFCLKLSVDR